MISDRLRGVKYRLWQRQLPKVVTMTDYGPEGVQFEAVGVSELRRIVERGWESDYLTQMLQALHGDDVLYDIGANIGLVALNAARICRTVAFEPDPAFVGRLRRNLELNPSLAVDVLQVAVSDSEGTVALFTDGSEGRSPSLVREWSERSAVEVEARTLDAIVEGGSLPPPTVLKLDIEGAEILALRGASALLQGDQRPRMLFLEVHDSLLPGFGSSVDEVLGLVGQAGYEDVVYEARRSAERHLILRRGASG